MNEYTKDQIEVLERVGEIIETEMIDNLDEQFEEEQTNNMYEKGLGIW